MKTKRLLLGLLTFAAIAISSALYLVPNFTETTSSDNVEHDKKDSKGIAGAIEFYHRLKADVVTGNIEVDKIVQARTAAKKFPSAKAMGLNWKELGPNNIGGRVRAMIFDNQDATNMTMYVGGVQGGLWKSTTGGQSWVQIPLDGNIAITSMCQTPGGDIFVGTGEGLGGARYSNRGSGGIGKGVYKQNAGSSTFDFITNTTSWKFVNRLASDKNGKVYAATSIGLKSTTDGGSAWVSEKPGSFNDVKCLINKTRVVATNGKNVWISNGGGPTDWAKSSSASAQRVEVAIAPSNEDIIYAVYSNNGGLNGIYKTTDAGSNWELVGQGGVPSFELFGSNKQGGYDNVIMVHKTNPDIVFVGGVDLWKGVKVAAGVPYSWTKKTLWNADITSPIYVHADQHIYLQHPSEPNTFYQGTDGGVSKSIDAGNTFTTLNVNFNVTQFYAVATHPNGGVLGGAQDNGTLFIDGSATHPSQKQKAREIRGGDGAWCATSMLNQEAIFASIYFGDVARSSDFGNTMQPPSDKTQSPATPEFYSKKMLSNLAGAFVTPTILWETIHYPNSRDTVIYIADQDYNAGDTVDVRSKKNNTYPFEYILPSSISFEDTIRVVDPVQSRLFVGTSKGIWMTKEALYLAKNTPQWSLVSKNPVSGTAVWSMAISADGDVLYYALNGQLGRLTNLLEAQEDSTADANSSAYVVNDEIIKSFSGSISSISIDPENSDKIVVTIGGTGSNSIYYSTNAASSNPTFSTRKGNLPPNTPVYASLIPVNNSKYCIIGTEFGIFTTSNITSPNPIWTKENTGIEAMVPVYQLVQQQRRLSWRKTETLDQGNPVVQIYPGVYNHAQIYAATHGRGFYTCKNFMSIEEQDNDKVKYIADINIYPNPVINDANIDFELIKKTDVAVNVYDINGRLLKEINLGSQSGKQSMKINTSDLAPGLYILQMRAGKDVTTSKFIKK